MRTTAALLAIAVVAGCDTPPLASYNESDMQGPAADLRGSWLEEGLHWASGFENGKWLITVPSFVIEQSGEAATLTWSFWAPIRGSVRGRVFLSEDKFASLTAAPDGGHLLGSNRGIPWRLLRVVVGPAAGHPKTSRDPVLSGAIICRLPVLKLDGRTILVQEPSTGSPMDYVIRECWVTVQYAFDDKGKASTQVVVSPLEAPSPITQLALGGRYPILKGFELDAIRHARLSRKQAGTVGGSPCWWVVAPSWDGNGSASLVAEYYTADPDSGAMPVDIVTVARIESGGNVVPTPAYLHRAEQFVRVTIAPPRQDQPTPFRVEAVDDQEPPLEPFLIAQETSIHEARWRTRALLAAKNRSLPRICTEGKLADLRGLAGRIEVNILDLNHESELAKDKGQKEAEAGRSGDLWREMAIVYKERIEVLKPILAAIKEEVSNRGK